MKRIISLSMMLVLTASMAGAFAQGTADDRHVVTIALSAQMRLDDTIIYLDQIAKLSGGPMNLRQRLARMDVAEFKIGVNETAVTSELVRFRILLAGVDASQFRLTGAKRTQVMESDDPIAVRKILAAASQTMRAKHPHCGQPRDIVAPSLDLHPLDKVRLEAKIPAVAQAKGSTRVDVSILVNGRMREIVPVTFETNVKSALDVDVRPAAASVPAKTKGEVLIKARDQVRIVALVGPVQVVDKGEAQEDGRLGDVIRVRNLSSNITVKGRVETPDVVLVEY